MKAFQLPEGWTREQMPHSTHCEVMHAPDQAGMVTVDFERREFRLGYSVHGPRDSRYAYIGRGWRDELCSDAIKHLSEMLQPASNN